MILSTAKFYAQERLDLEDINTLISSARTDSKFYTKEFLAPDNYIVKGFGVSGIGLKIGTIIMADATLILPAGTSDFSYYIAPNSPPNITIAAADLIANSRNYVELQLSYVQDTPVTKAFWDPSTNGGLGAEFNQEVDTVTDVDVNYVVVAGGFTGNPDRVPLAIIDTDNAGNITVILDGRPLFHRLGLPSDIFNEYPWASNIEPSYAVNLSGVAGTFVAGEIITFSGSGVTATATLGGTTNIAVNIPSSVAFTSGETVTGGTSGATGTVVSISESFTGADKDLACQRDMFTALMTEIKRIKGTPFWYSLVTSSLGGLSHLLNSIIVAQNPSARFSWSGTNLSITDSKANLFNFTVTSANATAGAVYSNNSQNFTVVTTISGGTILSATGTGLPLASGTLTKISGTGDATITFSSYVTPASGSDILAQIILLSTSQSLNLERMDGAINTGTSSIPIGDGQVMFVQLPTTGNRSYSGVGSGPTNYQVVNQSAFVINDTNFWIAFRHGSTIYIRGQSELIAGESSDIGDTVPLTLLQNIGLVDTVTPANYSSNIRGVNGESLVSRLGILTDAVGDEQEDRSGYLRSDTTVTWDGANLIFASDIILEFLNTKTGSVTQHKILAANSPLAIGTTGQSIWTNVDRTQATENLTVHNSGSLAIPPQTQANKDVFVFFRRVDAGGVAYLHLPFMKQLISQGQSVRLGASGGGSQTKATFIDPINTTLPTGTSYTADGVVAANGDLILFTNLSANNNRVYELSGVGTAIAFTAQGVFSGNISPSTGDEVRIQKGNAFATQLAVFDGTNFKVNDYIRLFNGVSGNFWELSSMKAANIVNNTTATIFSVNVSGSENFIMNFSIARGTGKLTGQLYITSDGTNVRIAGSEAFLNDTGVTFSAAVALGILTLSYVADNSGSAGTMKYFVQRWSDSLTGGPTGLPSYSSAGGGSTPAAGNLADIQFNGAGNTLAADDRFKWDTANNAMSMSGLLSSGLNGPVTLADNTSSPTTAISYLNSTFNGAIIEYTLVRNGLRSTGRMMVSNDNTIIQMDDQRVDLSTSLGITFTASISGANALINYQTTNTGFAATLKYSIRKW